MRIAGGQEEPSQALQRGMAEDRRHQPLPNTLFAAVLIHENIAKPGKCSIVGHDSRQSDLTITIVGAKDQGILQGFLNHLTRATGGPVGSRKKITNGVQVKARRVSGDKQAIATGLEVLRRFPSVS